ncbi:MAG TPA: preprotein translocase subunit YajC [Thermoanaerobaculia bacterium]|nr:preprotein translocase subunit YajC [Thermoanaerobaculia bacterium]
MNPITPPSMILALQAGEPNLIMSIAPMLIIFGIFYLLLILPMRKRQKAVQQMIDNIKKGDKVVTSGGLYGEVAAVEDTWVLLRIADNVRVKLAKSAIASLEAESDKGSSKS